MSPPILQMASYIKPVTWYLLHTLMQTTWTKQIPGAMPGHTSSWRCASTKYQWSFTHHCTKNQFVMSSATKTELATSFIMAKKIIPLHNTREEILPQPKTPIQVDNLKVTGVVNKTIISKWMKAMDMWLYWLRVCKAQNKFRFYWSPGTTNWGD